MKEVLRCKGTHIIKEGIIIDHDVRKEIFGSIGSGRIGVLFR
jgi:hypothetical protein